MISIYQLIDSRDGKPFYAGQTVDPETRRVTHVITRRNIFHGRTTLTPTQARICEIYDAGGKVDIEVLEDVDTFLEARLAEDALISKLIERGYQPTNVLRPVGNSGHYSEVSPSPKLKLSAYMTTKEAAKYLSVTEGRIRQLTSTGVIRYGKIGNANMIPVSELDAYNNNNMGGGRRKSS